MILAQATMSSNSSHIPARAVVTLRYDYGYGYDYDYVTLGAAQTYK